MAAFPVLHYHRLLLRPGLRLSRTPFSPPLLRPFSFPVSARSSSSSSSSASTASREETEEIAQQQQQQLIDVNPPRGTRDFPPEDMRLRNWIFQHFREVSRILSFEEVDFPVLESEALFIRKAGEEITQQLYNFEDKGGRRVVLRPELTPSLARLVIKQGKSVSLPLKWFTIGQCWRYERMTRGRRREHYQWNMDIFGVTRVRAEAELIHAIVLLFERLGITSSDVGIRISSRKVLQAVLQMYSIPENLFAEVCVIVDKLGKITKEEVEKELMLAGVTPEAVKGIVEVLSLKSLERLEEILGSDGEAVADLKKLFSLADHYGYSQWISFDASVVRGLAYYTGIVFEAFDREGKLRAICGGGRYDRLLSTFGSEDIPACGFGFGDAVVVELLKEKGLLPDLARQVDDIVFPLDEELEDQASMVASSLRRKGRSVDLVEDRRLKWVFKHAERINASRLFLVGNSEWQRGTVRVKVLSTREEYEVKIDELG
ncbi:histidine--tRNA ligase, chloroplastic/mitochondrial-like [Zingiber officinale]|uniref:histidine--tRNA ligase, chloroplastic/mitochondrial-like n=1 Tax=Zingiber officinale TaxID=94328 RepID=UPI001C4ADB64|nr:histidine--tRNA ligase, chloroplastic/mitochondrial-like [Zingiber officinale]